MADIEELILDRRTIHQFKPDDIPTELVSKALHCAVHAPNHKNTQPWRFTLIGRRMRHHLAQLDVDIKSSMPGNEYSDTKKNAIYEKFMTPPILFVVRQILSGDDFRNKEDYASMSCAIQNISLYLWSHQVGTKWSTGLVTRHEKTYELLNLDSTKENIVGFLWAGYPEQIPAKPSKIKVTEVLSHIE